MLDAKNSGSARTNPNYQTLLALKPRQVLLAERNNKVTTMKQCSTKTDTLNPDQKALLLQSVIGYLERNGFSKALKRLLSEAQIETDNWKTCSLNLEDVYGNYLETCARAETNLGTYKDKELLTDCTNKKSGDGHSSDIEQTVGNKKKKKSNKGENNVERVPLDSLQAVTEVKFGSESKVNGKDEKKKHKPRRSESLLVAIEDKSEDDNNFDSRAEGKSKDKKKKKKRSTDSPIENVEQHNTALEDMHDVPLEEKKVESKEKKRKKESPVSDALSGDVPNKEEHLTMESKKESFQTSEDAIDKEKKSSKKRKRLASEKDEVHPAKKLESEESKRRKTETLEETKTCEQITEVNANAGDHKHAGIERKRENGSVTQYELQNESIKPSEANRNFEKDEVNSAAQKTRRKQHESSAEPKTVNAFQRVKIDEVKFADERLQDNSYWAKAGADVGYGARAQEILGQVRGRDFRHEKTKKKRGSYRGGQIDLQAHSVKFNYSDED